MHTLHDTHMNIMCTCVMIDKLISTSQKDRRAVPARGGIAAGRGGGGLRAAVARKELR